MQLGSVSNELLGKKSDDPQKDFYLWIISLYDLNSEPGPITTHCLPMMLGRWDRKQLLNDLACASLDSCWDPRPFAASMAHLGAFIVTHRGVITMGR